MCNSHFGFGMMHRQYLDNILELPMMDLWFLIWAATWQNQQNGCAPSEDSDQPGHPPSLIRVFALRMKKAWVLSYPLSAQRRLWSDWADAQADLSLRWAHYHFVGFVMSRLIYGYWYFMFIFNVNDQVFIIHSSSCDKQITISPTDYIDLTETKLVTS